MAAFALRRFLLFIPTILGVSLIMFLLLNVLPGNAALMAGGLRQEVDPRLAEVMKKEWGLDKPLHIRYLTYMKDLIHGDLGLSFLRREKVSDLIVARLWPTFKLAVAAMLIAVSIGVPLGFISALRQGSWLDTFSMVGAVSGISFPQFWLGILLMIFFSVQLGLFPTSGYGGGGLKHLVLPAITLGVGYVALLARVTRAAVLEILTTDYIRTARSKGLSELLINRKHVLRNTVILLLTTASLQLGSLMGQTVIVEKLFSWPGIGSLMVNSIFQRDLPVTQGCVLVIVFAFLLINLAVDILYPLIDPRIELK